MDDPAIAFAGGASGRAALDAGRADRSELARRISLPRESAAAMPPSGKPPMAADDIVAILQWIGRGAEWADTKKAESTLESPPGSE